MQFLTTNRRNSLQYTALIAAYKACPPTGLEPTTSRTLRQMFPNAPFGPPIYVNYYNNNRLMQQVMLMRMGCLEFVKYLPVFEILVQAMYSPSQIVLSRMMIII